MQGVGGDRDDGTADQQGPGIPGSLLPSQSDHGDGGHDDDAVDDQRPRPRLTCPDARTGREISQRGEGQPERPDRDKHRPRDRRPHRPPPRTHASPQPVPTGTRTGDAAAGSVGLGAVDVVGWVVR